MSTLLIFIHGRFAGVEIEYEMYNPLIQKIEVLRLEKRLDNHLRYLRDCSLDYSTFPFDMEPVVLPKGMEVPVNTTKVKQNYSYGLLSPRNSVGGDIVTRPFVGGWVSE